VVTGTVRSAGSEPKWSNATATSTTASQTGERCSTSDEADDFLGGQ
jgi:hypothetical protein